NLGSEFIDPELPEEVVSDRVMGVVTTHFRPEFLNRVDEILVFHRLSRNHLVTIVGMQAAQLLGRLADRKITLEISDAAADWLAEEGYDPTFGARPLKRLLQTAVADPLAMAILEGEFREGDKVVADASPEGIVLRRE
ncbi:MAG: hypothetical protein GY773_22440, partial [Actinomycetia bacterium]|nr:hypothetical protein [Actinomycetes bacterium]